MNDPINTNLGCVVYTEMANGITAEWMYTKNGEATYGSGIGIRLTEVNKKRRFEGTFEITYLDASGTESPKLQLIISYETGFYKVRWMNNEKITEVGAGFERDQKLLVSYTEVN